MATALEQLAIGIDLGGTGTKFGIVNRDGNVLFSSEISTKKHPTIESFIDELYKELSILIAKAGGTGRIKGIGIGAPNGNFYT
ncbi:MAG: ROK family protein, partial [Ferruginibacter sp.]